MLKRYAYGLATSLLLIASAAPAEMTGGPKTAQKPADVVQRGDEQLVTAVTGTWDWVSDLVLLVKEDHTLEVVYGEKNKQLNRGTWELVDPAARTFRFTYQEGGWVDTLTLSVDGRRLDGKNNEGRAIHGTRRETGVMVAPGAGGTK